MEDYPGEWTTAAAESLNDPLKTVFVSGRTDVSKFRENPKFCIRIEVTFSYCTTSADGLPDALTSDILQEITDRLADTFHKDPVAVMTGIFTGDGERNWVFYTLSPRIFQRKFNEALSDLPDYPITITAENDPAWEQYAEMCDTLL